MRDGRVFRQLGVSAKARFPFMPPLQCLFGTAPLGAMEWGGILAFGVVLFFLVELEKALFRRRPRSVKGRGRRRKGRPWRRPGFRTNLMRSKEVGGKP